jgi:hypothetical protein
MRTRRMSRLLAGHAHEQSCSLQPIVDVLRTGVWACISLRRHAQPKGIAVSGLCPKNSRNTLLLVLCFLEMW